jgi:SulP family sulfate permease
VKKLRIPIDLRQVFLPFLKWLPELRKPATLRADIIAGITVALVLVPQSMAYAQLAGLPAFYGLYAAFLPPLVAALFGSSRQLATGPVAVVSLLTASSLAPLAASGNFIGYAILLAFMVGVFQLMLGLLRLGVILNFLSHPVVIGFTNAAAIIIATSQLGKLFGVTVEKSAHHYETVWNTIVAAVSWSHMPTLLIAVIAIGIMLALRKYRPRWPNVLIAVAVTTTMSWGLGFGQVKTITLDRIDDSSVKRLTKQSEFKKIWVQQQAKRIAKAETTLKEIIEKHGKESAQALAASHTLGKLKLELQRRSRVTKKGLLSLKKVKLEYIPGPKNKEDGRYVLSGHIPEGKKSDGKIWRIEKVFKGDHKENRVVVATGIAIVADVPQGLPGFSIPKFDIAAMLQLIFAAITIALIGFMEAISIAKAMAVRTRQRLDVNQELVGQGLSNIVGSFFQSYPVSGSFSRSAVNISAGAITGFSSVVTSLVVIITLLALTPLLFYLPQATLAAVIIMAVIGLVNVKSVIHAWKVQRHDGIVAIMTFVLTLAVAPHLEWSIMFGIMLSMVFYLYRTMRPRIAELSRHQDGALRDAKIYGLETCKDIMILRFDGSLYFANTSYFEESMLEKVADKPDIKYIIVYAEGINEIDATGEEMLELLVERLQQTGVEVYFTRMKLQVLNVLRKSGFVDRVGRDRFFRRTEFALDHAWAILGNEHEVDCPLNVVCAVNKYGENISPHLVDQKK